MMNFLPSAEQLELVESFVRPLEELFPVARLHKQGASDAQHWGAAAEFGWFGISLGEEEGGIGLSATEEALLFAQFGKHLLSPGFMAGVLAAKIAATAGNAELAGKILGGEVQAAMAVAQESDREVLLVDGGAAQICVLVCGEAAAIFETNTLSERDFLDDSQWSIKLESAKLTVAPLARCEVPEIGAQAALLIAAQLTGIAAAAQDMAIAYAKIRQQFGAPIGSFQAVKHHCANMAMQSLAARDTLSFAAVAMAEGRADARFLAASALNIAIRAALFNARTNIQIHGGIGFSSECDAHLFVKRAHVLEALAGGIKSSRVLLRAENSIFEAA